MPPRSSIVTHPAASDQSILDAMTTEADVRELALALPEVTEKPSYGTPGFRVADKLFARIREEGVLVLWRENEDEKQFLIDAEPGKFFTIPHYDGYPHVLLRLDAVDRDELGDLLEQSWRVRAPGRLAGDDG
jgi:hypothetical protein